MPHLVGGIEVKPGDILLHDGYGLMRVDGLTHAGLQGEITCLRCRKVDWFPGERGYLEDISYFTWLEEEK